MERTTIKRAIVSLRPVECPHRQANLGKVEKMRIIRYDDRTVMQFNNTMLGCSCAVVRTSGKQENIILSVNRENFEACKNTVIELLDKMEAR